MEDYDVVLISIAKPVYNGYRVTERAQQYKARSVYVQQLVERAYAKNKCVVLSTLSRADNLISDNMALAYMSNVILDCRGLGNQKYWTATIAKNRFTEHYGTEKFVIEGNYELTSLDTR